MILYEITGTEKHPAYEALEVSNGSRHYDFLMSIVNASLQMGRQFLSSSIIKALNYHAIACLHAYAGEYRPCRVTVGTHEPPEHYRVQALMDDFINQINRAWEKSDAISLASYVLWRLNYIHPFINGNGRTARAACYFVICVKVGAWLPGTVILPELLRQNRPAYVEALKAVDASLATGTINLQPLHALLSQLIAQQIQSSVTPPAQDGTPKN